MFRLVLIGDVPNRRNHSNIGEDDDQSYHIITKVQYEQIVTYHT